LKPYLPNLWIVLFKYNILSFLGVGALRRLKGCVFLDSKFVTKVKEQYQKSKIEAIWENRFHNAVIDWETETAENQTNGWMFFISRPGMELTRKLDEKGQDIFAFYKREIENFLKEKGSAKNWMADRDADKLFTQTIVDRRSASGAFITFIWPFSLSDEAPRKTGVMFHLGHHPEVEDAPPRPFTPECGKRPFSMYDTELQKSFTTTFPNPPGVKSNQNDEAGQDLQWSNFASSKIFPTNALLNENNWGRFRNLMSLQFIEVRLLNPLDHIGDVLGEQVEALQKFQRHNSGFSSFSGAPGTGKSTLLHMVCADRIAKNWAAGADHRIMYYVPSVALKTEATREVHAILQYVYALEHELCNTLVTNYFFPVTQEDLYLENLPPSSFNLISPASDKKISELIPEFKHLSFPLDDKDALRGQKITQFKEHLRRLIYGVFEDFSKFQAWHAHARSVYANAWSDMTINLYSIDRKQSSQMSDASFPPNRFIHAKMKDEFLKYATNPKVITHINGDGNNTQFWDPTTMVVGAYNLGVNDEQLWKGTVWSDLKGKADYIVIDEVQDITLTEARILLKHFSNRQQTNQLRPFRFIIAGDAYQNIKQLIFVPDNKHIHSLFEDWRSHLSVQFVDTALGGERLSKGLEKTSTCVLRASYRTHDEMLPSIAQIMTNIRNIDSEEYKKGVDATAKPTPFGRDGLLLIAKSKGKELTEEQKKQQLLWMEDILRALRYQFDVDPNTKDMTWNPEAANKEIQVSYCYDEIDADWKVLSDQEANTDLHPLSEVLSGKNTVWHKTLDELLMNFTKLFRRTILKNIDDDQHYDPRQLWQTEAEARGVFTIQQIKGLTLPITITQPPKQFSKGLQSKSRKGTAKGFKRSDWSKLLVELTRAQYVNVLMENHNALPNLDSHFVSNIRDPTSITQLLFNVARFSTGYIMPLEQAYFIALNNHENAQTWVRLRELVDSHPDPKMGFFAEWPRNMLLALYKKSTDGLPYDSLQSIGVEFQKNGDPQFRYGNQRLKLDEIHAFEENNLLGDRFSQKTFASLLIFLQCNHLMREKIQGEDNTFDVDGLVKSIQLWLLAHKQHGSKEEWEPSWFNFILDPDASQDEDSETSIKKGKIDGLIEKTFSNPLEPIKIILPSSGNEPMEVTNPSAFQNHEEELKTNRPQTNQNNNEVSIEWKWPTISFPRLNMGSWHGMKARG
jgi:hypothetical protein